MEKQYPKISVGYYVLMLFLGIYSLFFYFYNQNSFVDQYHSYLLIGFSLLSSLIFFLSAALFILSLILIFLIFKKKLSKISLILPSYYVFYYFVWSFLITLLISWQAGSLETSLLWVDKLSKFDVLFYVLNIILPSYFLYCIYKKNN